MTAIPIVKVTFPWDFADSWAETLNVAKTCLQAGTRVGEDPYGHFKSCILSLLACNPDLQGKALPNHFPALQICLTSQCDSSFVTHFIGKVLPWMARCLAHAPQTLKGGVSLLTQLSEKDGNQDTKITFTQEEVVILMVMGFFSLFPDRFGPKAGRTKTPHNPQNNPLRRPLEMPCFNFISLFMTGGDSNAAKVRCLLEYFTIMERDWGTVVATGLQIEILRSSRPILSAQEFFLGPKVSEQPLVPIDYRANFPIENCQGCIQADFANEWIGGGVLRSGCVQEEIRMMVSTELLVSLLVCERMLDHESITISGCAQYSDFVGYGQSFRFTKEKVIPKAEYPRPGSHIRNVAVVAFDALNFSWIEDKSTQFKQVVIDRELIKAFAAFSGPSAASLLLDLEHEVLTDKSNCSKAIPLATGNWGCGVFEGHLELKFLIQWIAASAIQRPVVYCAIGPDEKMAKVRQLLTALSQGSTTVGVLYSAITSYLNVVGLQGKDRFTEYVLSKICNQ